MSNVRPQPQERFGVEGDCLVVGGMSLMRLCHRVGRTPFYAYDRSVIDARIRELRRALPPSVHLHYAIKANPMPAVVQFVGARVDGLDVASAAEMHVALDAGVPPAHISFAGPGKTDAELMQAAASGVVVNVESLTQIEALSRCGDRLGVRPDFAVRVNPDFDMRSSGMRMGGGPKQFGIDAEDVPAVLERSRALNARFIGFHIFSGSQNLRAAAIGETQDKALELAIRLARHAPEAVQLLNIGGGFGIPYFPKDEPLDLQAVGSQMGQLAERAKRDLPHAQLVVELGRYIVGEAGIYVCQVIDRKVSRGRVFLVTDGGLHHHLAATGNFGQFVRQNYPVIIGNRVRGQARETASVVGPLCTPLDLLADQVDLARAEVGDLVVVFQSGAYGRTASPAGFLSHPDVLETLV